MTDTALRLQCRRSASHPSWTCERGKRIDCSQLKPAAAAEPNKVATLMRQTVPTLTDRELEVLTLAAKGKTAHQIGQVLGISKRTVDEHAKLAIRRCGAKNRAHAVAICITLGLIRF